MLTLDDARWASLEAANGQQTDLRALLRRLESQANPSWDALWSALYHQGSVRTGSYVAVPHLVRIHEARGRVDWETYALVASIEAARGVGDNPDVPEWARAGYEAALKKLAHHGLVALPSATHPQALRSILAVLALAFGAHPQGRLLIEYTEDEVLELLDRSG